MEAYSTCTHVYCYNPAMSGGKDLNETFKSKRYVEG